MMIRFFQCALAMSLGLAMLAGTGCGMIADPDRIRIARIDDEYITRGDLFQLIRRMDDTERPQIQTRGDLLRVLNQYIDARLKLPVARQLAEDGQVRIPRERAREFYFQQTGDEEEQLRAIWAMDVPEGGATTPLMRVYNLTPDRIRAMKNMIEQETDKMEEKLLADEAIAYLAAQGFQAGEITLDQAALEQEYRFREDDLVQWEWIRFRAIRFPAAEPGSERRAAEVHDRVKAGEDFEAIVDEFLQEDSSLVIESEIENNPNLQRFRGFWLAASESRPGDIIGPVYLPQYQMISVDERGRQVPVTMPDAYLILKVLEHRPERVMTLEEATPALAGPILIAEKMKQLRAERGVEVYEDNLPDPARFARDLEDAVLGF